MESDDRVVIETEASLRNCMSYGAIEEEEREEKASMEELLEAYEMDSSDS